LEDLKRGEPVHDSYGLKFNSVLFLHYGFLDSENGIDDAVLTVKFDDKDPALELKK
jgi:hypothetical protein